MRTEISDQSHTMLTSVTQEDEEISTFTEERLKELVESLEKKNRDLEAQCANLEVKCKEEEQKVEKMFQVFEAQVDEEERVKKELGDHFQNLTLALNKATETIQHNKSHIESLEKTIASLSAEADHKAGIYKDDMAIYESLKARNASTEERLMKLEKQLADEMKNGENEVDQETFDALAHWQDGARRFEARCAEFDQLDKRLRDRVSELEQQLLKAKSKSPAESPANDDSGEITVWKSRCQGLEKNLTAARASRDAAIAQLREMKADYIPGGASPPKTPIGSPLSQGLRTNNPIPTNSPVVTLRNAMLGCVLDVHSDEPVAFSSTHSAVLSRSPSAADIEANPSGAPSE